VVEEDLEERGWKVEEMKGDWEYPLIEDPQVD
jgi:hypothetical protein